MHVDHSYKNFPYVDRCINCHEMEKLDPQSQQRIVEKANSVACLILEDNLLYDPVDEVYKFSENTQTFSQRVHECSKSIVEIDEEIPLGEKEPFYDETSVEGKGTAFLVNPKFGKSQYVLTAGHCVTYKKDDSIFFKSEAELSKIRIVFGFHTTKPNMSREDYTFKKDDVFKIAKVKAFACNPKNALDPSTGENYLNDWALIKLDRETERPPLDIDFSGKIENNAKIFILGHPHGVSLKYVEGEVKKEGSHPDCQPDRAHYFEADFEAFYGHSGSPVFNAVTQKVIGLIAFGTNKHKLYRATKDYLGTRKTRIQAVPPTHEEKEKYGYNKCQKMRAMYFVKMYFENKSTFHGNSYCKNKLGEYYLSAIKFESFLYTTIPLKKDELETTTNYGKIGKKIFNYFYAAYESKSIQQAALNLGICCFEGIGTKKDYSKAIKYFEEALSLIDDPRVCEYLGRCYENGYGVEKNADIANEYYEMAEREKKFHILKEESCTIV